MTWQLCLTRRQDTHLACDKCAMTSEIAKFISKILYLIIECLIIRIVELEDGPSSRSLRQEIEVLRMEQNTWGLLQAIMPSVYILSLRTNLTTRTYENL